MRIANVTTSENLLDVIQKLDRRQLDLQQQISDGQKITLPEDDGMKMGRLVRMETEKSSLVQYQRNSSYANEYLDASHLNLDKLRELSVRSQELARTSGAGQFLVAQETNAHEVNQILEEALNRINSTHRKKALFGGTLTKPKFGSTEVINGQRYEKKLSLDDNYVPKNLKTGDSFTLNVAGLGPYVVDTDTLIPGTNNKVSTSAEVISYLMDRINDDSRKTGIVAKFDAKQNLVLYGAVDEDFEFSARYDTSPDAGYVFPNDPERQTLRGLPVTQSGSSMTLSKTTANIEETLYAGDKFSVQVAGRIYEVDSSTVIDSGTGAKAQTATDVFNYLRAQIENDFPGVMNAAIDGSGNLVVSRVDAQNFDMVASLETTSWRRTLHVDAPKVPEATKISLSHPDNWKRLTGYSQGDLVYFKDKIWESQFDENFNHLPDTNLSSAWKEMDSTYDGEREDWNLTVDSHEHRQYFITPDGWLFESLTDAQNHVINSLNQNADVETPQATLDKIYAGVNEVTMSVAQFKATGSRSDAARVSFDPRTQEYRLNASANGENIGGSNIVGLLHRELGTGGKTQSEYKKDEVFVYNGEYYKARIGVPKDYAISDLPATAGNGNDSFYNMGTRLPSAGYNEVLDANRDQKLIKGEYLHDLALNKFYLVLEDFSTGGHNSPYNPATDTARLEEISVYESPQGLDWNQGRTYNSGDVVYYNNRYWQCLKNDYDNQAFDPIDLVDYYVVHPDDEFSHNAEGNRVQNDAWLSIGESFGHVASFRADRTDWPEVIIAPPTRGGEGAEAEAVVDSGGRLVGLRLTNTGNYTFEDEMPQTAIVRTADGKEISVEVLGDNGKVFGFSINPLDAQLDLPTAPRLDDTFSFATGKQTFLTHRDQQGDVINITYNGNEKNAETYVGKGSKISYYLNASNGGTKELGEMANAMIDLRDALRTATPTTYATLVEAADQKLIALEDKIVDKMGEVASKMARMEAVHAHDESYYMGLDQRIAKDIDVDLSEAIVRMTRATNAYQAAIQVGAHIMNSSLLNFL
jgi:flagellin-like hook-associated protein FlgL